MSNLIITKGITKSLDEDAVDGYKMKQAHVELAKRMFKRDPATAPGIGDRVQYLMVKGKIGSK